MEKDMTGNLTKILGSQYCYQKSWVQCSKKEALKKIKQIC